MAALALAAPPPCEPPRGEHTFTLGLNAAGHRFGGLAVLEYAGDGSGDFTLVALSPAGPPLFTVNYASGVTTAVAPLFPEMQPWLERLPLARDLRLLHTNTRTTCAAPAGRILTFEGGRRWCGVGGPARVVVEADGRANLRDVWRGYTLTYAPVSP